MVVLYKFWDSYACKDRNFNFTDVRQRSGWVLWNNSSFSELPSKTQRAHDLIGGIDSPVVRKKFALALVNVIEDGIDTDEIIFYDQTDECQSILAVIQITDASIESDAYACKLKVGDNFETRVMSRDELREYFMWYGEEQKVVSLNSYLMGVCV